MPTQFTLYQSTDASAPVLNGVAGALTTLLDAILVNGYGAKAAAGWSIAYTAASRRVYLQGAGSAGCYYRVRDDGGGTGGAKEALIYGAEAMSDVNTVVSGKFPDNVQSTLTDNALVIRKSVTADATAKTWFCYADSRTCYLFIISDGGYYSYMLGDYAPLNSANTYVGALTARITENSGANSGEYLTKVQVNTYNLETTAGGIAGHFIQRDYTGSGGSTRFVKMLWFPTQTWSTAAATVTRNMTYPNRPDASLWMSRLMMLNASTGSAPSIIGWLRGLWSPTFNINDANTGASYNYPGSRSFASLGLYPLGNFLIETSNTVE